jgi:hypothetical protein
VCEPDDERLHRAEQDGQEALRGQTRKGLARVR